MTSFFYLLLQLPVDVRTVSFEWQLKKVLFPNLKLKRYKIQWNGFQGSAEDFDIQCLPHNRITLGQHKSDNNNRMIQLTDVFCVLLGYKWTSNY